jgi:hypothetical protein
LSYGAIPLLLRVQMYSIFFNPPNIFTIIFQKNCNKIAISSTKLRYIIDYKQITPTLFLGKIYAFLSIKLHRNPKTEQRTHFSLETSLPYRHKKPRTNTKPKHYRHKKVEPSNNIGRLHYKIRTL